MQTRRSSATAAVKLISGKKPTERKITEFTIPVAVLSQADTPTKMGDKVTTCELKDLIKELQSDMNKQFSALSTDVSKLSNRLEKNEEKTEKLEKKVSSLDKEVTDIAEAMNEISMTDMNAALQALTDRIQYLEKAELESAIHSRKYNVMIHGIPGKESENELTERKVRDLMAKQLSLGDDFASKVLIGNCHRLPKPKSSTWGNKGDPDPVVVKFLKWADREAVLRSARNLEKGSKVRIRTHLPAPLAKTRAKLSTLAYEKRQGGLHARVRERGASVVMETRAGYDNSWQVTRSVSAEEVINFRIGGCKIADLVVE
jgi:hypothetical protein